MEKMIVSAFLVILLFPALLFALAGDFFWPEGWIFSLLLLALSYSTILYLYRKDPTLLAERYKKPGTGNQPLWDRYVIWGIMIGFIIRIAIMPLDARRFGWSPAFPLWVQVPGLAGLIGSSLLLFRSFTDNPFLSALVRLQDDRQQRVVSDGVYGFVRHPMYPGGILMFPGAPLLPGPVYGVLAGLALAVLLMARIRGEEALPEKEPDGCRASMIKVRYRRIPFLWQWRWRETISGI
jgi:protein-S-isoprenylcysteine O-methyltransferase Ste14